MRLKLSTKLLNISIASLCRAKQLEKAEAAILDGIRLGVLPDVVTYNTLITGYCQIVGFDAGYSVLHRMKEAGISPDVVTYNSLIAGATRQNLFHRCHEMLEEMFELGINPDLWTHNTLMHCYFILGKPDEASGIFRDIMHKNIALPQATVNIMINGLCRNGYVKNALSMFRNFRRYYGFIPGIVTYNVLINGLCKSGMWKETVSLFRECRRSGLAMDAITYTTVMKCCFRCRHLVEGLEVFLEMKNKGYAYDLFSYCTVIGALLKSGRMQYAVNYVTHMVKLGHELDIESYNTLMNLHCKKGELEKAYYLLEVAERRRINCDEYTHTICIDGLCKAGDFDGAERHLSYMQDMGLNCLVAFNCLIDRLCKAGSWSYALRIFRSMVMKDSFTYSSLVQNLCKERRYRLAAEVSILGIKDGIRLLKLDKRAVVTGLSRTGSRRDVERFTKEVRKAKTYNSISLPFFTI